MIKCIISSPAECLKCRQVKQLGIPSCPHNNPSNFFKYAPDCFSLYKSRTVGRTRCDCFHTQEVITPDLPQLWLRQINIDKKLMRCQAGTRPFPLCLLMTPMERKNDLNRQCHCLSQVRSKSRYLQAQSKIISGVAGLFVHPSQSCHYRGLWRYHSS